MSTMHAEVIGRGVNANIDAGLLENASVFVVDADRLAIGLREIEVPQMAIESLTLNFKRSRSMAHDRVNIQYEPKGHIIPVKMAGKAAEFRGSYGGAWSSKPNSHALQTNYGLAVAAHEIKEYSDRHPDTVKLSSDRIDGSFRRRMTALLASGLAGSTIGGTATGRVGGAVLGGVAGATADVISLATYDHMPNGKALTEDYRSATHGLSNRASNFAQSQQAFELFNDIVQIEFTENN